MWGATPEAENHWIEIAPTFEQLASLLGLT